MAPAFSSTRQAAAFALLVLVILLSPVLVGRSLLRSRDQIYSSLPWGTGPYAYLYNQIYEEKGDIDVAFMGSSIMWHAIDTPYFQKKLSEKLGRPAVARTLCWDWMGTDPFYRITKDLLEHRNVHMIVFCDQTVATPNTAHTMAAALFQWADHTEDLAGLQLRSKMSFYGAAIVDMPKNLLGRMRANLPAIDSEEILAPGFGRAENPFRRLGSLACTVVDNGRDFVSFTPSTDPDPADVFVYSEANRTEFQIPKTPPQPMQVAFIHKVAELAREHHVHMVYLGVPHSTEFRSPTINPDAFWPEFFPGNLTMMGIPPANLFAGLSDDDVMKLHWQTHLNINGQEFFTPVVTLALVQLYEDKIGR